MSSGFIGTIAGSRHYSTSTIEGSLLHTHFIRQRRLTCRRRTRGSRSFPGSRTTSPRRCRYPCLRTPRRRKWSSHPVPTPRIPRRSSAHNNARNKNNKVNKRIQQTRNKKSQTRSVNRWGARGEGGVAVDNKTSPFQRRRLRLARLPTTIPTNAHKVNAPRGGRRGGLYPPCPPFFIPVHDC